MSRIVRTGYLGLVTESHEGLALSLAYKKPKRGVKVRLTIAVLKPGRKR